MSTTDRGTHYIFLRASFIEFLIRHAASVADELDVERDTRGSGYQRLVRK